MATGTSGSPSATLQVEPLAGPAMLDRPGPTGGPARTGGIWLFIVRRILQGLLVLVLVSIVVFAATQALPGDPARAILGRGATPASLAALREQLHLNQPVVQQYLTWATGLLHGDAGRSFAAQEPVSKLLGDRPLSVEVTSNDQEIMLEQGRLFATWARNIVIKIPIVNEFGESCLGVIHRLSKEGIAVNATAILSFNQAILAAKAGATYVSIFAGRLADEGNDPVATIKNVRQWLDDWSLSARIIVGSIRTVMDIQNAALAGAHIVTIPPQFLPKMVDHRYTRETVRQFMQDAEKTIEEMSKAKVRVATPRG